LEYGYDPTTQTITEPVPADDREDNRSSVSNPGNNPASGRVSTGKSNEVQMAGEIRMRIKFVCNDCDIEVGPCKFSIPESAMWDRSDLIKALRRCPFENSDNERFNGVVPRAKWKKVD